MSWEGKIGVKAALVAVFIGGICVGVGVYALFSNKAQHVALDSKATENATASTIEQLHAQEDKQDAQIIESSADSIIRNQTPIADFERERYAKYVAMYAKPISQWEQPHIDEGVEWKEFAPLPEVAPSPKDNPITESKVRLGKRLFEEPKLSKSGQISCQSCHNAQLGFGDGLKVSIGHNRAQGRRNAPNIQMAGLFKELFWDGRADSLESQALFPIQDGVEMANTLENMQVTIKNDESYYAAFIEAFGSDAQKAEWERAYPALFEREQDINFSIDFLEKRLKVPPKQKPEDNVIGLNANERQQLREQVLALFGTDSMQKPLSEKAARKQRADTRAKAIQQLSQAHKAQARELISIENITKAIASYERTLIPQDTRFNRFLKGEYEMLSPKEIYGMHIYRTKGRCMNCHFGDKLSDEKYHNLNIGLYGRLGQDLGRYEVSGKVEDIGAFRTPSLVNVRKSAPYGHNGIFPNFVGLMHLYDKALPVPEFEGIKDDKNKPKIDVLIKRLDLNTEELEALEAFMWAL